jgi:hypothetical protein
VVRQAPEEWHCSRNIQLSQGFKFSGRLLADAATLQGEFALADLLSIQIHGSFLDAAHRGDRRDSGEFWFVEKGFDHWEEHSVADTALAVGLYDNRLRLTSRWARSQYDASDAFLDGLADDDDEDGRSRFRDLGPEAGSAGTHQADLSIWRGDTTRLSAFALYSNVDGAFEPFETEESESSDSSSMVDLFEQPNRTIHRIGTSLGLGPLELTLSRSLIERRQDGQADEVQHGIAATLDLKREWSSPTTFPAVLTALLPGSIWAELSEGSVTSSGAPAAADAKTSDIGIGMDWNLESAYLSLHVRQHAYDGSQSPDGEDAADDEAELSFGLSRTSWGTDVSLGWNQSDTQSRWTTSATRDFSGSLSVALQPARMPRMSASLEVGQFSENYFEEASSGNDLTFRSEVDLAGWLSEWEPSGSSTLKMMYRYDRLNLEDDFNVRRTTDTHRIGILMSLRW